MWIPRFGTDFCVQMCLSLWCGVCHALPVVLVCLFSILRFFAEISATAVVSPCVYPRNTNDLRFWPKFRPAYRNCIAAQWFNMQSSAGPNFSLVIGFSRQSIHFGPFLVEVCLLFTILQRFPS